MADLVDCSTDMLLLAVLRNTSLFILFGIDSTLLATADFHVLNTDTYSWDATYYVNGAGSSIDGSNGNGTSTGGGNSTTTGGSSSNGKTQNETLTDDNGLSGGAIAGIVVGIVAVVSCLKSLQLYHHPNSVIDCPYCRIHLL